MNKNIIDSNIVDQYKSDITRYAMIVNKLRSIPSIKDGLKTVHRRIVYAAYKDKRCINRSSKLKSADLVGVVMGTYHPHGDSAIYSSIKPMTNWFEINHPLFMGEGNWGNFQGDDSAAMRYTETYLSPFAMECVIGDLSKSTNVVDWNENYNQSTFEPEYLPVTVPLLLINGSFGIGYGIQCSIPTHNIIEVIDATLALIKNPNLNITLVPDQCMPCHIIETDFASICDSGLGSFKVRALIDIGEETIKGHTYPVLIVKSLPDSTYLDTIRARIITLIEDGHLPQIADILDKSYLDKKTSQAIMKYVIVLKKGSDPYYVRDVLYKSTDLEKTINVSFEVLDGIESLRVSYTDYLKYFINFRKYTKFRYYSNVYQKADTVLHEKEAFIKVIQSGEVDNIINMIKKQTTIDDHQNIEYLIKKLDITDLQASYILNANIKKLSKGYLNKYLEEAKLLTETRAFADSMIKNPTNIEAEIIEELTEYKMKYGKPRQSQIIKMSDVNAIPEGLFNIVITENNFIKKISGNDYGTFKGDAPKKVITINNTDSLIMFDILGKVYKIPVHKIPISDRNSNGIDLRILIKTIAPIVQILSCDIATDLEKKKVSPTVLTLSNDGFIKRVELYSILTAPVSGFTYINLDNNDTVSEVLICKGADVVVFQSNKALRVNLNDIPVYKRNAKGVKTFSTNKPVQTDGLSLIKPNSKYIIVVTENGMINKLHSDSLPRTDRNRAGNSVIKLSKGDRIKAILGCDDNDIIKLNTNTHGLVEYRVSDIKMGSSISTGNRMINKTSIILNASL